MIGRVLGTKRWALFVVPLLHLIGGLILVSSGCCLKAISSRSDLHSTTVPHLPCLTPSQFFGCDVDQGLKDAASTLHLRVYGDGEKRAEVGVEMTNVLADAEDPNSSAVVAKDHSVSIG